MAEVTYLLPKDFPPGKDPTFFAHDLCEEFWWTREDVPGEEWPMAIRKGEKCPRCENPREFFLIDPVPRQVEAWDMVKEKRYLLFGGARGGSKSWWLRWTLMRLLINWYTKYGLKNVRVGIFCEDYPTLRDRQISKVLVEFPKELGSWNGEWNEFRLVKELGGGVICFRNLDNPSKYQSSEWAAIAIDEATKNPLAVFDTLRGSLRWKGVNDTKFLLASNPGGQGHLWIKAYFIDKEYPKELESRAGQFGYVKSLVGDNPHNAASYIEELGSLTEKVRRAWLEGDWDVFEGQVFEEWRRDLHVIEEFDHTVSRYKWSGGLDFGYARLGWLAPFASDSERSVCVDEFAFKQLHAEEAGFDGGKMLLKYPTLDYIAADSAMWARTGAGQGPTIAEEFQTGLNKAMRKRAPILIPVAKGPQSRQASLQLFHRYLAWKEVDGKVPPWNQPRLRFHQRCKYAIKTIPALPYDARKPEDVDTNALDDPYDGCLTADSLIATERGEVPISDVLVGERVLTREGWRKVLRSGLTGVDREVWTVKTANRSVHGTPSHPVWTENRGWICLDAVKYGDILTVCPKSLSTQELGTKGIQNRHTELTPHTSIPQAPVVDFFIDTFGKTPTGQSPQTTTSTTSTTKMATAEITPSKTSIASPPVNISPTTVSPALSTIPCTSSESGPLLRSGMDLRPASPGTANRGKGFGPIVRRGPRPAPYVETISKRKASTLSSVQINAGQRTGSTGALMTKTASVRRVGNPSESTDITKPETVQESVLGSFDAKSCADVYNLSVESTPEFFANGILVHNCRYWMMSRPLLGAPIPGLNDPDAHPGLNKKGKRKDPPWAKQFQPTESDPSEWIESENYEEARW